MFPDHKVSGVLSTVMSFLAVLAFVIIIILVIKYRRTHKESPKPAVELNEEEFKDNIEVAKGNVMESPLGNEKPNKYMEFNDEQFVDGVPRRNN